MWLFRGWLKGLSWSPISANETAPNDGVDTPFLPLEDVTGPPRQDYDIANIVAQWQPNLVVITLAAPRGNAPAADAPLPRQDYRERENGIQWQQDWRAQGAAPNASWNFADPIPRQDYRERENGLQWQQSWSAQRQAPVAAWNFADPIPRQDYRERENGLQWVQDWGAQRAAPNAGWNVVPPDNPPPLKAYTQHVNVAWQPNLVVINVPPKNGASVVPDNPPLRPLPRVDAQWQVTWPAQSAADNAAWNFVTPDNPPPLKAYPQQVNAAWQPNLVVINVPPKAGGSIATADAPTPRQDYAQRAIAALWMQGWPAQKTGPVAGWGTPAAQVDNPPPLKAYPQQVNAAWQPNLVVINVPPKNGGSVATADAPPPQRPYLAQLIASHFRAAVSLEVRTGSAAASSVDDPPRSDTVWVTLIAGQWALDWRAQRAAPVAGLLTPPAVVNNPPPRNTFALLQVCGTWQLAWGAQHASPNAGWNFMPPDNPPPRNTFALLQVCRAWQQTWGAQSAEPNASWNIPRVDNPPGRRPELSPGVHGAWIVSWKTQRAGPPTQEAPPVVPVYGWGARSKIGSATGRDPWTRIGSSSASASNGKIGSEDA